MALDIRVFVDLTVEQDEINTEDEYYLINTNDENTKIYRYFCGKAYVIISSLYTLFVCV